MPFVEERRKIIILVARTAGTGSTSRPDIRHSSSRVEQHVRGAGPHREQGPIALARGLRAEWASGYGPTLATAVSHTPKGSGREPAASWGDVAVCSARPPSP